MVPFGQSWSIFKDRNRRRGMASVDDDVDQSKLFRGGMVNRVGEAPPSGIFLSDRHSADRQVGSANLLPEKTIRQRKSSKTWGMVGFQSG